MEGISGQPASLWHCSPLNHINAPSIHLIFLTKPSKQNDNDAFVWVVCRPQRKHRCKALIGLMKAKNVHTTTNKHLKGDIVATLWWDNLEKYRCVSSVHSCHVCYYKPESYKLKMFFSHESIVSLLIYFNSHFCQKPQNVVNCSIVLLIC